MRLGKNVIRALMVSVLMIAGDPARGATPNLESNIDRPLRYRPEAGGFVIENGPDSFNRPLYGGNTAFRVDAGDRPEFSLYVPGRGGVLRVGFKTRAGAKWLRDAEQITTRYVDGMMKYTIHDPLLGAGTVRVEMFGLAMTEGAIARVDTDQCPAGTELVFGFGGANGDRGSRSGDIGTERESVSRFFSLRPEYCKDNHFEITDNRFILRAKPAPATFAGVFPIGTKLSIADGNKWQSPDELLASAGQATTVPVIVGHLSVQTSGTSLLALQRLADAASTQPAELEAPRVSALQDQPPAPVPVLNNIFSAGDLQVVLARTQQHFYGLSKRVTVDTPDEFINSAVSALNMAADGVWDGPSNAFMHGAVAWRTKLLGWRGPYAGMALGDPERTRAHLDNWLNKQNTRPIDPNFNPGADKDSELTRSEAMLHTNGDLTQSHYDMNLVAIDALFRYLLWTGDKGYAMRVWPVIQRHLAWERRLFRREYGPEKLPLYEAYAAIWASDDLQYSGGGSTHGSAYNYYHNVMAARVAKWIGEDPSDYQKEADLIKKAMQTYLWLPREGWFAEFKDLLGQQLVHPSAGVWTNYHTIDSLAADPFQAWQMGRYIDTQIPHIPIRGKGVPEGFSQISTTSWMPYTWSINNVVMAETMHTALSRFQADQSNEGYSLLKGALLDSMFIGQCPGNVGMATYYDDYRRESQRDFADAVGTTSRAVVEGLFGIKPDALARTFTVRPGFPASWDYASIHEPGFDFEFKREDSLDTYMIGSRLGLPVKIVLQPIARRARVEEVTVNGIAANYTVLEDSIGQPRIEIGSAGGRVTIRWAGDEPERAANHPAVAVSGQPFQSRFEQASVREVFDPQHSLDQASRSANGISGTVANEAGFRTLFAKVQQDALIWWVPIEFETRNSSFDIVDREDQQSQQLRFRVRNNTARALDRDVTVVAGGVSSQLHLTVPAMGVSAPVIIHADGLLPGSNPIAIQAGPDRIDGIVTNWKIHAGGDGHKPEAVALADVFNDRLTQIFKNQYLSPRSPFCSLALASDGIGMWTTFQVKGDIDDTGLRAAASASGGKFTLPQGIEFAIPGTGDAKNIAFASQWDNYPREISAPLRGKASHAYFLLAGSTNAMQSRFENARIVVTYVDGSTDELPLVNPTNYWPIEKDYFVDDFAFARPQPVPPRVDFKTGAVRIADPSQIKGQREAIPGGAGFVLDLPIDERKELRSVTLRAVANDIVVGLIGVTLVR